MFKSRLWLCMRLGRKTTTRRGQRRGQRGTDLGDHCKYFSWYDEEEGTKWQRRALLEARDEIRKKDRVIEQLQKPFHK
ncbi:unnamed protein product [Brassica napus]|uniref:(rape) hypothetical protein n=1 Tax=Brassica napus TaxID=3708 RepID=A0A816JKW7_BRANA|nr:unnamed protein product [Brassica napus]